MVCVKINRFYLKTAGWILISTLQIASYMTLSQGSYPNLSYFLSCKRITFLELLFGNTIWNYYLEMFWWGLNMVIYAKGLSHRNGSVSGMFYATHHILTYIRFSYLREDRVYSSLILIDKVARPFTLFLMGKTLSFRWD